MAPRAPDRCYQRVQWFAQNTPAVCVNPISGRHRCPAWGCPSTRTETRAERALQGGRDVVSFDSFCGTPPNELECDPCAQGLKSSAPMAQRTQNRPPHEGIFFYACLCLTVVETAEEYFSPPGCDD